MSREKLFYFTLCGGVIEMGPKKAEMAPVDYRVYYEQFDSGKVICTQLDRKTHTEWIRDKLLHELDATLTDLLEAEYEREQQRMVEDWDNWRYGS